VGASETHYYLTDGLGSTLALTDEAGDIVNTYDYDVFGALRAETGSQANDFTFAGEQVDAGTGLQYLRARYYDAEAGRFVSRDPLAASPFWMQHDFAYASSNPLNLVDPLGLCGWTDPWNCADEVAEKAGGGYKTVSSIVQVADLLPWGAVPGLNIPATVISWPLDVAAFGFATIDVALSDCPTKVRAGLFFNNSVNLAVGIGGQAVADLSSLTVVGPPIVSGFVSAIETTLFAANTLAIEKCGKVSEVKGVRVLHGKE
jgi:RHS repeat-associated protein